jgi:RNA 3'-terminal phosphate cyclase (ATP)
LVSQIPGIVGAREVEAFCAELPWWDRSTARPEVVKHSPGPGNAMVADVVCEHIAEVFTAFGERNVSSETVAATLAKEVERYVQADVPIGEHLADQILLPMAMGRGGSYRTLALSDHTRTQADVIRMFLGTTIRFHEGKETKPDDVIVEVLPK